MAPNLYSLEVLIRAAAGTDADFGDWLCKMLGICA